MKKSANAWIPEFGGAAWLRARSHDEEVERVEAEPQQRGEPPPGDAPAEECDHGQQEREHDRSARRGQEMVRLRARGREKRAEHQVRRPVAAVDGEDPAEDPDHRSEQRADRPRAGGPADEGADADAGHEHG